MELNYYRRTVYGRTEFHPTGEHADAIKILTKRKTLTGDDIEALESLGHVVKEVVPPSAQ